MKDELTWREIWKKVFHRVGAYCIVYIVALIYVEISSFERMVMLGLTYIVVDVTLILIKLEKGK
jgi:hypothetical protein